MASQTDRLLHSGWLSTNNIASPSFGNPHNQCCTAALEQLLTHLIHNWLLEFLKIYDGNAGFCKAGKPSINELMD